MFIFCSKKNEQTLQSDMAYTGKDFKELPRPVILALETATLCGSVALVSQSQCLAEFSLQTGETHSRERKYCNIKVYWPIHFSGAPRISRRLTTLKNGTEKCGLMK